MHNPNSLSFNAMRYAIILKNAGVEKSDVHAQSLAETMNENVYTKNETENMFDTLEHKIDKRSNEIDKRFDEVDNRFDQVYNSIKQLSEKMDYHFAESNQRTDLMVAKLEIKMLEMRNDLLKTIHSTMQRSIGILGSLIVVVGVVSTFAHYFFH